MASQLSKRRTSANTNTILIRLNLSTPKPSLTKFTSQSRWFSKSWCPALPKKLLTRCLKIWRTSFKRLTRTVAKLIPGLNSNSSSLSRPNLRVRLTMSKLLMLCFRSVRVLNSMRPSSQRIQVRASTQSMNWLLTVTVSAKRFTNNSAPVWSDTSLGQSAPRATTWSLELVRSLPSQARSSPTLTLQNTWRPRREHCRRRARTRTLTKTLSRHWKKKLRAARPPKKDCWIRACLSSKRTCASESLSGWLWKYEWCKKVIAFDEINISYLTSKV